MVRLTPQVSWIRRWGGDNSDDSQIAGLKRFSFGGASTEYSEAPLSQDYTTGTGNPQKSKKKKKKTSKQSQGAIEQGGLQASPSLSAGLATQVSQYPSSPIYSRWDQVSTLPGLGRWRKHLH